LLPNVPFDDIEIIDVLGSGRNGACFKVKWNSTEYAMKQFDVGRDGYNRWNHEIEAYRILHKAWGDLLPRPIFLSESVSGGILFLGLQLGRAPVNYDKYHTQFDSIMRRLKKEYSIRHNDAENRNMIIISDAHGVEKLVAIDFEDWDYV
jgi:thiamine kinase-like enzyme